jgi:ribosome biogenesis GTPase / thiamine phosphate phosphatase
LNGRSLAALGWTDELEAAFTTYAEDGFEPARVVAEHRGGFAVRTERDDRLAHVRGKLREEELFGGMPTVGDWVVVVDAGERYAIEAVLPRRTKVSRKTPWLKSDEHVLVANVDTVFIVAGLDGDFNVRRLERYLATAWDSGADPVVVLTKLDVNDDPAMVLEAESIAIGVPVHAVSNVTGEGLEGLDGYLGDGRTIVLIGSSGVGKSTLVNTLAGRELMPIGDLRNDGRGRHTTRHRQLHALRNGALLIDTPGLRELQLWEGDLDRAFADVAELTQRCRFNDCAHRTEPGCAINAALADGSLDAGRWDSYQRLEREMARLRGRRSHREQAEMKRRWRDRARETRYQRRHGKLKER